MAGTGVVEDLHRQREARRRLADQRRDGVLVERAVGRHPDRRRPRAFSSVTSAWATASSVPMPVSALGARELERLPVGGDRAVVEILQRSPARAARSRTRARAACSVRRSFSRSAALTCAAYWYSRTVLRTRSQRSGAHDAVERQGEEVGVRQASARRCTGAPAAPPVPAAARRPDSDSPPRGVVARDDGLDRHGRVSTRRAPRRPARAPP